MSHATTRSSRLIDPVTLSERQRRQGLNLLLAQTFMAWCGFFIVVPLISVHYVEELGWAAASIGLVLAVRQFTQQGFTFISGALADIVGAKMLICFGMALRTLGFLSMVKADSYHLLMLSMVVSAVGGALFESPRSAAIAALTMESERRRFFSLAGVLGGLGIVLGTQAGALLISQDFDLVAISGAVFFFGIFVFTIIFLPNVRVATGQAGFRGIGIAVRDRLFVTYNAFLIGYWFIWAQFYISVPLVAMSLNGGKTNSVAWIYGVNSAVTIALGYLLPRALEKRVAAYPMLLIGVALAAAGIGLIAVASTFALLLCCVFLISVGTVLVRPGEQTVTAGLASPAARGSYFGVASIGVALGGGSGNWAGGWLYDLGERWDLQMMPWLIFASLGCIALAGLWWLGRAMDGERAESVHKVAPAT